MSEQFVAEIIQAGRITIPEAVRDILCLNPGDKVRITIEKIKEAN